MKFKKEQKQKVSTPRNSDMVYDLRSIAPPCGYQEHCSLPYLRGPHGHASCKGWNILANLICIINNNHLISFGCRLLAVIFKYRVFGYELIKNLIKVGRLSVVFSPLRSKFWSESIAPICLIIILVLFFQCV